MYEDYVSCLVVVQYLVMPHISHVYMLLPLARLHVKHLYVLLPLIMPHVRHTHLGPHIAASLRVKQLAFGLLIVVSLVLLQWNVLGSDYYLVQLLFYNY